MTQDHYPDFTDKVVVVYLEIGMAILSEQPGFTIRGPRFEEQVGQMYIVGESVTQHYEQPVWHEGAIVNIRWESVSHYLVFESIEAYREAAKRHLPDLPKTGWFGRRGRS